MQRLVGEHPVQKQPVRSMLKGGYVGVLKEYLAFLTLCIWKKDSPCDTDFTGGECGLYAGAPPVCAGEECGQEAGGQPEL